MKMANEGATENCAAGKRGSSTPSAAMCGSLQIRKAKRSPDIRPRTSLSARNLENKLRRDQRNQNRAAGELPVAILRPTARTAFRQGPTTFFCVIFERRRRLN